MIEKPKKPFTSLEDARIKMTALQEKDKLKDDKFYPCCKCFGVGGEYEKYPAAYEDPRFYPCDQCNHGKISKDLFEMWYNRQINEWKNRVVEYFDLETTVESALKKLLPEEQEALKKWWRQ